MSLQPREAADFLEGVLTAAHPQLDFGRTRVLHETLITPASQILAEHTSQLEDLEKGIFIGDVINDPGSVTDEQMDRLLSNYFVERKEGTTATGVVRMVLSSAATFVIPEDSVFSFGGLRYQTMAPIVAAVNPQTANSVPIVAYGDRFTVSIPVTAEDVGSVYNIASGSEMEWEGAASPYESATAESDFTGGSEDEANEDLVARIQSARAAKTFSARPNILAWVQERDPSVDSVEVVGSGDPELSRGVNNLFGIRTVDTVDVYVKKRIQEVTVRLVGTILDRNMKTVRLIVPRDAFPGFYSVSRILPVGITVEPAVTEVVQGVSTDGLEAHIGEISPQDAAFTRYQFLSLTMTDRGSDMSQLDEGDTIEYDVTLTGLAGLAPLQDLTQARAVGPVSGSYLVRAAIPVFTTVDFGITNPDNLPADLIDLRGMRAAVADALTGLPIGTKTIRSGMVSSAVADFLPRGAEVIEPLHITGRIVLPDRDTITVAGTYGITIPNDLPYALTHRVCGFYATTRTVGITVEG